MHDRSTQAVVFAALVALSVVVRLVSPEFDAPNFGAVTAAALFAGFYFRRAAVACAVPLASMVISDYFLGGYARNVMIAVYASLLVPIAWRALLRHRLTPARVGFSAATSSVAFFLISNGMVWYTWYPRSVDGFVRCFTVALPFFANTLGGDLAFSACIFGLYALVCRTSPTTARVTASCPVHAA